MADEEGRSIDSVNKETLELLQRRIESKVRSNFFRTVTLPIGGGGVAGVIIAVVLWIPAQVNSFLQKESVQKQVETEIKSKVVAYFQDDQVQEEITTKIHTQVERALENRLPEEVRAQVSSEIENYFASEEGKKGLSENVSRSVEEYFSSSKGKDSVGAHVVTEVKTYFASEEGATLVKNALPNTVANHFKTTAMQTQVGKLVTEFLGGDGREIVVEAINKALKPVSESVSQSVLKNRDRLVLEFEQESLLGEQKESIQALQKFIRPENIDNIMRQGRPVVLTKTIKEGNRYNRGAIDEYLRSFQEHIGPLFQYVAIFFGAERKFLVLVPSRLFQDQFSRNWRTIMDLLNSGGRLTEGAAREALSEIFGPATTRFVEESRKVEEVLTDSNLWPRPERIDDTVAVVDAQRRLTAITSRERLIEGLLETLR